MPLYPNEMVPLQIDVAIVLGRYRFGRVRSPRRGDSAISGKSCGWAPWRSDSEVMSLLSDQV